MAKYELLELKHFQDLDEVPEEWYSTKFEYNVFGGKGKCWFVKGKDKEFFTISSGTIRTIQVQHGKKFLTHNIYNHYVLNEKGMEVLEEFLVCERL